MIDSPPQIVHLAVDLHKYFIETPAPVRVCSHPINALSPNLVGKHRAEPAPPEAHCLVANIDPPLRQQVLDVPQRQRVLHIHHHNEADYLR